MAIRLIWFPKTDWVILGKMHWILADVLMFISSVTLFLAVRKAALDKLPTQFNNLAMFAIPLFIFVGISLATRPSFALTLSQALVMLFTGIVLAYFGNATSLKSIELAPNAGYSLILSKSYVVLTSVLAVFLFDARLTLAAGLAILLIVCSSALIMVNPKQTHRAKSNKWVYLAIGSFLCWAFLSLSAKYFALQGVPMIVFLVYIFTIVCICIVAEMLCKKVNFNIVGKHSGVFFLIGLTSTGFNFFNFYAISIAPNVGYVNATNTASIGAVTILSALIFKDELTKRKLAGVAGIILGLFLLFVWH